MFPSGLRTCSFDIPCIQLSPRFASSFMVGGGFLNTCTTVHDAKRTELLSDETNGRLVVTTFIYLECTYLQQISLLICLELARLKALCHDISGDGFYILVYGEPQTNIMLSHARTKLVKTDLQH